MEGQRDCPLRVGILLQEISTRGRQRPLWTAVVEAHKHTPLINSEHFHSLLVSLQTEHRSSRPGCHPQAPAGSFTLSELTQLQPCTETRGTFRHLNYLVVTKRPLSSTQHYNVMAPTLKALYAKKTYIEKRKAQHPGAVARVSPLLLCRALPLHLCLSI